VNQTEEKARAQQEAADSATDVHTSSEDREDGVFNVESIRGSRARRLRTGRHAIEYLIHWHGYDTSHDTWELEEDLQCERKIRDYHSVHQHGTATGNPMDTAAPVPVPRAAVTPPPLPVPVAPPPRVAPAPPAGSAAPAAPPVRRSARRPRARQRAAAAFGPYDRKGRSRGRRGYDQWSDESNTEEHSS